MSNKQILQAAQAQPVPAADVPPHYGLSAPDPLIQGDWSDEKLAEAAHELLIRQGVLNDKA